MPPRPPVPCRRLLPGLALVLLASGLLGARGPLSCACRQLAADEPSLELPAVRRLLRDPSPSARAAAYRRLAGSSAPEVVNLLVGGLVDPHPYVRRAVAGVLGTLEDPRARAKLAHDAPRWRAEVARREVCQAYALWLDLPGSEALRVAARDPAPSVRVEALRWLADDPSPEAQETLRAAVVDGDPAVRAEAWAALRPAGVGGAGGLGSAEPLPDATAALADADARVRIAALEAVVAADPARALPAVVAALDDPAWSVRLVATGWAARTRSRAVLEPLVGRLDDPRVRVAQAAGRALVALTGIPFDPDPKAWRAWLEGDGRTFDPSQVAEGAAERAPPPPPGSRTVEARFLGLAIPSRHVAFVLDGSGSMAAVGKDGRTRWAAVLAELEKAFAALGGAHVNVAVFHDEVEAALPRALPLDASRREALLRFVRARAPHGKTALYDGIAWGLADPEVDTLIVLSDGAPSAGQFFTKTDLLAEVRRANRFRRARIDVVAIGADDVAQRWRDALQEVARDSAGTYITR